jgi:hypothetical protein
MATGTNSAITAHMLWERDNMGAINTHTRTALPMTVDTTTTTSVATDTSTPAPDTSSTPTVPDVVDDTSDWQKFIGRSIVNGTDALQQTLPYAGLYVAGTTGRTFLGESVRSPSTFFSAAGTSGLKVSPALVSAIVGPAVADGASFIAPNLVPKYEPGISNDKKMWIRAERAAIGGATVALGAALIWLKWPQLLRPRGMNFISDAAINGGKTNLTMFGHTLAQGSTDIMPMIQNGVFSNRLLIGAAGGIGTVAMGTRALTSDNDSTARNWGIAAAVTGAATVGGMVAAKHLTKGEGLVSFWKPNKQWFIDYGSKVAPITVIPAGTAAYNNFTVVDAFNRATDPKSPYRAPTPTTKPPTTTTPSKPPTTTTPPKPTTTTTPRSGN